MKFMTLLKLNDYPRIIWAVSIGLALMGALIPLVSHDHFLYRFDKVYHFALFGILAFIPIALFHPRIHAILCAFSLPGLGFVFEYLQNYVGSRSFSSEDLIANNIGIITGGLIGMAFRIHIKIKKLRSIS